jgi:rubrerythrin
METKIKRGVIRMIDELIIDEQDAIDKYSLFANNLEREKQQIMNIIEDEKRHKDYLMKLKEMM